MRTASWALLSFGFGLAMVELPSGCESAEENCFITLCNVRAEVGYGGADGSGGAGGASGSSASTASASHSASSAQGGASGSSANGGIGSSGASTGGAGGSGGAGGAGGSGGAAPASCVPSELAAGSVASHCGVFVSSSLGQDGNDGSPGAPFKTLATAVMNAKGKPVYACGEAFVEALTLSSEVTIYGGLDCTKGWRYDASKKTALTAAADAVPLTLTASANAAEVFDFAITAADAGVAGGSSIAVLANGATATLTRVDVVAGKGADGAAGVTPSGSGLKGADAPAPLPAGALDGCGTAMSVVGGQPGQSTCDTVDTSGGLGGNGTNLVSGGDGSAAAPQPEPNAIAGHDGLGGSKQTSSSCNNGNAGADGLPSTMPGTGAIGVGTLSATGYQGPIATAGQSAGGPGFGGGGGGGAKKCANGFAGPAGGGGGAGGCGGLAGGAGQSAGSSIGLVSIGATLTLDTVTVTTATGGTGGAGGDGQPGGPGGAPGIAGSSNGDAASACNGGKGGQGGRGGSGGGGLGGHSIGIAISGGATPIQTAVTIIPGAPGIGGMGGDLDMTPGVVGGDGTACKTLDFANPASCVK